jgi:hypothetical protein
MDTVLDKIEEIKTKISDNEYLELMNALQILHDAKPQSLTWNGICDRLEDDGADGMILTSIGGRLETSHTPSLPLNMARLLYRQAVLIRQLLQLKYRSVSENDDLPCQV